MNPSRSSATAALLVVTFVAFGIGVALVVLLPSNFPQRALALAAGCGLAFGMVTAAGHLAERLRPTPPAADTDDLVVTIEPVRPPTVLLRELTGPTARTDRGPSSAPVQAATSSPSTADRSGVSAAGAGGSRRPRG